MAAEVIGLWGSNTGGNKLLAPTLLDVCTCICQNPWGSDILSWKAKANTTKKQCFLPSNHSGAKMNLPSLCLPLALGQLTQTHMCLLNKWPCREEPWLGISWCCIPFFYGFLLAYRLIKITQTVHLVEDSWTGNKSFKKKPREIRFSLCNKSASVSEIILSLKVVWLRKYQRPL